MYSSRWWSWTLLALMLVCNGIDGADDDDDDGDGWNEIDEDSDDLSIRVLNVTYWPKTLLLTEGEQSVVNYNFTYFPGIGYSVDMSKVSLVADIDNDDIAKLHEENSTMSHSLVESLADQQEYVVSGSFVVGGLFLGKTKVELTLHPNDDKDVYPDGELYVDSYVVGVIRKPRAIDYTFNIMLTIMILLNNMLFGLLFEIADAKAIFKKPVAPVIGFICQYTIMPTTAYLLGRLLELDNSLALGLLTMGCSPGGGASNIWTLNLDGDVTLSLVMTFVSNIGALFMMPAWLLTVGQQILGSSVSIPFQKLIITLCVFIGPMLIGIGLRKWKPGIGPIAQKVARPITLCQALIMLTVGLYSNFYIFYFFSNWRLVLCGMFLPYIGLTLGMLAAAAFCQPWTRIKTIGIETAFQNGAIAMIVLRRSLPQPEADITSVVPIIAVLFTPLPLLFAFIILLITKAVRKRRKDREARYVDVPTNEINMEEKEALPTTP